ncbi:MAG: lipid IV(A) palmitoyltransferase PagP [Alphaproteobacteria bacterium]|jgi:palmitoyl transferase|nr:lipid IV(A) palmitoyltransferase PagP [Alphaproteobacteria bacterium]
MLKIKLIMVLCFLLWNLPLQANTLDNMKNTWNSEQSDLYLPFFTWHARTTYDNERILSYNEYPGGMGLGKGYLDEKGNWHGIYAMIFRDSHNSWKPIIGYGWEYIVHPFEYNKDFHAGLGYTVGVATRRSWDWIPLPIILPIASIGYKELSVQMTYIPFVGHNSGNVWFFWLKINVS